MGHGRRGVLRPIIPNLHLLHLYPSGPLCTLPAADASCLLWICVEDEEDARVCRWGSWVAVRASGCGGEGGWEVILLGWIFIIYITSFFKVFY